MCVNFYIFIAFLTQRSQINQRVRSPYPRLTLQIPLSSLPFSLPLEMRQKKDNSQYYRQMSARIFSSTDI